MSRKNSMRNALSFDREFRAVLGECAGSGMVWVVIILRYEGDVLKQAVFLSLFPALGTLQILDNNSSVLAR